MGNRLTNKRALGTVSAHGIGEPIATRAYAAKSTVAQTTEVNWEVMSGLDGVIHHDSVLEYSDFDREQSSDLNVKSMFLTIREVSPGVIASGGGSVVNFSSVCAHRGHRIGPLTVQQKPPS